MATYEELAGLELGQRRIEELLQADQGLVDAWLVAVRRPPARIKSPVGWMLAGVRAGERPPDPHAVDGARLRQQIVNAENWVRNVGHLFDDEASVEAHLFDDRGYVRECRDPVLRARLIAMWKETRS